MHISPPPLKNFFWLLYQNCERAEGDAGIHVAVSLGNCCTCLSPQSVPARTPPGLRQDVGGKRFLSPAP